MGTTPAINLKGMSTINYRFLWDKDIRHYAYEPKDQKAVDDIFRTQGKRYKHLYFSVWLDEPKEEPEPKPKKKPGRPKKSKQTKLVEEAVPF
jgi:hypothetical protein